MKRSLQGRLRRAFWFCVILVLAWCLPPAAATFGYPVQITDSLDRSLTFTTKPQRVVSLLPAATEILCALRLQNSIVAVTIHDTTLPGIVNKTIVGGFLTPSLTRIKEAAPDLVILSPFQLKLGHDLHAGSCKLLFLETQHLEDAFRNIRLLGRIFGCETLAERIVAENQSKLALIRKKVARIPPSKRKRVMRFMGRDQVMAPGDDSFQNELIAAAGGISPVWGKNGSIVPITQNEWNRFNPQIIYGCGGDRQVAKTFFSQPGWNRAEAIKNGRIYYFPCDLTCRVATRVGYFVCWLSSVIYADEFADPSNLILPEKVISSRPLATDLNYVRKARIVSATINDFINKTLVIDFTCPQTIISTLEGQRTDILTVGNHYWPPPCWALSHGSSLDETRAHIFHVLGLSGQTTSFLFTGADMDHLAIKEAQFKEMRVYALVTAGVCSNALRTSRDEGSYYEPGTINILLLTNMRLTPRAMARAIITATEAKSAALDDLDIRSSANPMAYAATGTGTDNIIVVEGRGCRIDNAGGHTKMGELIASAVYAGVREAIHKQNGLKIPRDIFQRLKERHVEIYQLVSKSHCEHNPSLLAAEVEQVLLEPRYAAFLESALVLSDAYEKGLIRDLSPIRRWAMAVASEISGKRVKQLQDILSNENLPVVLKTALDAIFTGVINQTEAEK